MFALIMSLSRTIDLIAPSLSNHHVQVAYIANCLAEEIGLKTDQKRKLIITGALHDIGAISLQDKITALEFEERFSSQHAQSGAILLRKFKPLDGIAELVRYHHLDWNDGAGLFFNGVKVPEGSHILHLADRIAVQIIKRSEILSQIEDICKRTEPLTGIKFKPELVSAFLKIAKRESFWLDATSSNLPSILANRVEPLLSKITANRILDGLIRA